MHYQFHTKDPLALLAAGEQAKMRVYTARLGEVAKRGLFDAPEAALATLTDESALLTAEDVAAAYGSVRHVVVIGIGGSSVGTEAVYRALERDDSPLLHVLDVVDLEHITAVAALCAKSALSDFVICVISKSGGTTETLVNTDALLARLLPVFGDGVYSRMIAIGNEGTALAQWADAHTVEYLSMPEAVGGRYSIFSVVGLVPLALLRVPVREFWEGGSRTLKGSIAAAPDAEKTSLIGKVVPFIARTTEAQATHEEYRYDHVEESAALYVARLYAGDQTQVFFAEHERLLGCAKWCEQLYAESLGKQETDSRAHARLRGMAPVIMTPRELHSTAQLYLSRHPHVFTTFIGKVFRPTPGHPLTGALSEHIAMHEPRTIERIPAAIMEGVHHAYAEAGLPHARIALDAITPLEIGAVMAERIREVMLIAHLLHLNAFDQPHVELYKKATRAVLERDHAPTSTPREEGVYVLFDIGGTKTRVAVSTDLVSIEATAKFATPHECALGIAQIIDEVRTLCKGRKVRAAAGDIRGILNPEKTELAHDAVLTDWVGRPLVEELSRAWNAPVFLENDAALCALGEAHFGAGKGYEIVAYHTVSTGVGGARIVAGHIDESHTGFEPGKQVIDVDHTVHPELQAGGTLEELISGVALEKRTGKKPYETPQSDTALWDELASYLAYGLKNTVAYWSPDAIVLGGSMIVGDPRILREDIERHLRTILGDLPAPPVLDATLTDEAGLFGALVVLRERMG